MSEMCSTVGGTTEHIFRELYKIGSICNQIHKYFSINFCISNIIKYFEI